MISLKLIKYLIQNVSNRAIW